MLSSGVPSLFLRGREGVETREGAKEEEEEQGGGGGGGGINYSHLSVRNKWIGARWWREEIRQLPLRIQQ